MESASSCGPQANSHPPPPRAQAPKPTGVILRSEFPSFRVSIRILLLRRAREISTAANLIIIFFELDEHTAEKVRLLRGRKTTKERSIGDEDGIERNGFAAWIGERDLLGAGGKSGSHDEKRVRILEGDAGSFSIDDDSGGTLEAAAADGDGGAVRCGNSARSNRADT